MSRCLLVATLLLCGLWTIPAPSQDAEALIKSGIEKSRKGELEAAMAAFSAAIAKDPQNARAYHLRALCLERRDLAGAFKDVNQAIALAPTFAMAQADRADFDRAIELGKLAETPADLLELLQDRDYEARARKALRKCRKAKPETP